MAVLSVPVHSTQYQPLVCVYPALLCYTVSTMNNTLPTTRIAGMTIAQYQNTLRMKISRLCSVSVDISQSKRFMRPTIYSWHVTATNGKSVCDVSTYGESGDIWALSFDGGAKWITVDSFGECVRLCERHFGTWQD